MDGTSYRDIFDLIEDEELEGHELQQEQEQEPQQEEMIINQIESVDELDVFRAYYGRLTEMIKLEYTHCNNQLY
jgi:hypothetical protein